MEAFLHFPRGAAGEKQPGGAGAETGPRAAAGKGMTHAEENA